MPNGGRASGQKRRGGRLGDVIPMVRAGPAMCRSEGQRGGDGGCMPGKQGGRVGAWFSCWSVRVPRGDGGAPPGVITRC